MARNPPADAAKATTWKTGTAFIIVMDGFQLYQPVDSNLRSYTIADWIQCNVPGCSTPVYPLSPTSGCPFWRVFRSSGATLPNRSNRPQSLGYDTNGLLGPGTPDHPPGGCGT